MRALLLALLLSGCATTRQCAVGVVFVGGFVPSPVFSCDVILSSEDEEESD